METMTKNAKHLLHDMLELPPDREKLRRDLEAGIYSPEDVSMAALEYVYEGCFLERRQTEYETEGSFGISFVPGLHSSYLYELTELLLSYGLDPNGVYDHQNIMEGMMHVDNEYVGADTLRLLLEHGGDPQLEVDGESFFEDVDFDVMFGSVNMEDRALYESIVHCWFVLLGFGVRLPNGKAPVDAFQERDDELSRIGEFDPAKLRDHRRYTFGLSYVPNRGENWALHIFDRQTLWEVARL